MRIVRNLLAGLVILWAILAITVRVAAPFIADHRDDLASYLSSELNTPITIGDMSSRWYGLSPLIELHDVTVGAEPDAIDVNSVSVSFAAGELLGGSLLDALRVTVDGMQLTLVREESGQLHLEGIGILNTDDTASEQIALPNHVNLVNTRVVWIDRKAGRAPMTLDNVAVILDRDGSELALHAHLETEVGRAEMGARLDGLLATTAWNGDAYLHVENLDVANILSGYIPESFGLSSLQLNLTAWSEWRDAFPVAVQGDLRIRDLDLSPRSEHSKALAIPAASAEFTVNHEDDRLRVGVRNLELQMEDHAWPATDLALSLADTDDGTLQIAAAADYLRIDDVVRMLQVRVPWAALGETFDQLQPGGEIRKLRMAANIGDQQFDWRGTAAFSGLQMSATGGVPGIENISGTLHGQQDHVQITLDSSDAKILFTDLFRNPLPFDRLAGQLDFEQHALGWRLSSDKLVANTPHIKSSTRLALVQEPGKPLFVDVQSDFADGDAAYASLYYPAAIMGDELVAWLDKSVISGKVISGSALVYGPADSFAFEKSGNGVFEVVYDTRDVVLAYREGWPHLENIDAYVKFFGNHLDIVTRSATLYDSKVVEAHAHVASLEPTSPIEISGRLVGPLKDPLQLLRDEGLRDRFGQFADALQAQGDSDLSLDFTIPLVSGRGDYALDGKLRLNGSTLSLPDWQLDITQIDGTLDFTLDGLRAKGIKAHALGSPIRVDLAPAKDGTTRISSLGTFALADIHRQLPALDIPLIKGKADFAVDIDIPPSSAGDNKAARLTVASQLEGIAVALPTPFGKAPPEKRSFNVTIPLSGKDRTGHARYADLVDAEFGLDGRQVDVLLGGDEAVLQRGPGVRIGGHMKVLDVLAWADALGAVATKNAADTPPLTVDLRFDRVLVDEFSIKDAHLNTTHSDRQWRGIVDADSLAGTFVVADAIDNIPVQIELQRLHLDIPVDGVEEEVAAPPDPATGPDPLSLPGLVLSIVDFKINQAELGQLRLDAQPSGSGMQITRLDLSGGQLELQSAGHWSREGDGFVSQLGGHAHSKAIGDFLVALGYSRQVEEAKTDIEFFGQWPGNPAQVHRTTLDGHFNLDVGRGRLAELDPGVTRVVGLLNLNALTRRLRLDFSDFYKKGYSFDSIKGHFRIADGVAKTEDLSVLGPTGSIDLKGTADLVDRTLDQHVTVVPNLDATLPIAGTIAGGPVAGIAVYVAQKLVTSGEKINRFEYSLSGSWDSPEITQLDTGGTLSKILGPGGDSKEQTAQPPDPDAPLPGQTLPQDPTEAFEPPSAGVPSEPASSSDDDTGSNGLMRLLKKGDPHGADIPGTPD